MAEETNDKVMRGPDFVDRYANNVRYESSVWDLKVVFGALDQFSVPTALRQHTGVSMPWSAAKIMLYFVYVNILFHEAANGKVSIPDSVLPPPAENILSGDLENDPTAIAMVERIKKLRADLF